MQCATGLPACRRLTFAALGRRIKFPRSMNDDVSRRRLLSLETRCNPLILHSGFSGVDAMCDRPPGLSEADVRGSGPAYQVSPLYERRPQSAQVALQNPLLLYGAGW